MSSQPSISLSVKITQMPSDPLDTQACVHDPLMIKEPVKINQRLAASFR